MPTRKIEPLYHPDGGYLCCGAITKSTSRDPEFNRQRGDRCKQSAGWGTDHPGAGTCKFHQGNSTPMKRIAYRELADMSARRELARFGVAVDIGPAQALLAMVREAAGNVAYLGARLDEMIEAGNIEREPEPEGPLGDILQQAEEVAGDAYVPKKLRGDVWDQRTIAPMRGAGALFGPKVGISAEGHQFQQDEDQRAILRLYGEWADRLVKYSKAAIDAGVAKAQVELAKKQAEMLVLVLKAVLAKLGLSEAQVKLAQSLLAGEMRQLANDSRVIEGTAIPQLDSPKQSRAMDITMRK